jgi:hypothetical protein
MAATSQRKRLILSVTAALLLTDIALGGYAALRRQSKPLNSRTSDLRRPSTPLDRRSQRWQDDLHFFAREFPVEQVDFAKLFPPEKFHQDIAELERDVPKLTDPEVALRLMKLVASARVSHTMVTPQDELTFHPYPIRFVWFSDGPAVTEANQQYKAALGARIVRIGTMTPEQLESAIAPFLSYENGVWLHEISRDFMLNREVADHFGLANRDGSIAMTFTRPGSEPFQLKVAPAEDHMISAYEAYHLPVPLSRRHPDDWYWYEYLSNDHALYIQYNRCRDKKKEPFKDFAAGLFRFVDGAQGANKVERVIVDLRFNGGGDSGVIDPLINGLKSRPWLSTRGHLYVLTGSGTYSSGMMAAVEFRNSLHALLVGEPSGSPPNEYGEIKDFTLPNSKIDVQYTTRYFRLLTDSNPQTLEPDLTVHRSIADFLSGRDPALDVALKHPSRD